MAAFHRRDFAAFLRHSATTDAATCRKTASRRTYSSTVSAESLPIRSALERTHAIHPLGQPDGHRRLRVRRVRGAGPGRARPAVRARWASPPIARHRHKNVTLYRQGEINFIINAEPNSFAQRFARLHGPSVCAMAFRVKDAAQGLRARARARRLGLRQPDRPDGAEHPGDQGHRRFADLLRRPLARQGRRAAGRDRQHQHLRRRLRADPPAPTPSRRAAA